jgi:hypothetical protein
MEQVFNRAVLATAVAGLCLGASTAFASSHREAPFITETPKVDGTDFYMFRSYESGRKDTVTLIANYMPFQDPFGGPNYYTLDENAVYEIHIDNNADAQEDITFRFDFANVFSDIAIPVGDETVSIPLKNSGGIGPTATDTNNVQLRQEYEVTVVQGGTAQAATNATTGGTTFRKPLDYIGEKTFSADTGGGEYAAYADAHIYDIAIPGCDVNGRVFVGQRQEAFAINVGDIFDLVNLNPLGERDTAVNDLADHSTTSMALEVPTACLTGSAELANGQKVIGGWTTSSLRQARILNPAPNAIGAEGAGASISGGAYTQISRLGMPLVNEVVIGLKDKNRFNASEPANDTQFLTYVTNPTLPELLEILFGVQAPDSFPRNDLVAAFLTGIEGLNQPVNVVPSEMQRLNTAIDPVPLEQQNDLGVLAGDTAGFPNGRRPIDDVVDIELRVAMGVLLPESEAPADSRLGYTDGVRVDPAELLRPTFPYLATPIAGSADAPQGDIQ